MEKIFLFCITLMCCSLAVNAQSMTDVERSFLVKHLIDTKNYLHNAVDELSETQLNFKASPERWSIKECIEHIANTEILVAQKNTELIKQPSNPEKRSEVKNTDAQVINILLDRSSKRKAPEILKPGKYTTAEAALLAYDQQRDKTIEYCKTTRDDLRDHLAPHVFLGMMDAYQWYLLVGAHQKRHTLQIEEVKAEENFPKK